MRKALIKNAAAPINGKLKKEVSVLIGDGKILETDIKGEPPESTEKIHA